MPQLMPLKWMFSSMMILLIMISASMLYSEKIIINKMKINSNSNMSLLNMWYW